MGFATEVCRYCERYWVKGVGSFSLRADPEHNHFLVLFLPNCVSSKPSFKPAFRGLYTSTFSGGLGLFFMVLFPLAMASLALPM